MTINVQDTGTERHNDSVQGHPQLTAHKNAASSSNVERQVGDGVDEVTDNGEDSGALDRDVREEETRNDTREHGMLHDVHFLGTALTQKVSGQVEASVHSEAGSLTGEQEDEIGEWLTYMAVMSRILNGHVRQFNCYDD